MDKAVNNEAVNNELMLTNFGTHFRESEEKTRQLVGEMIGKLIRNLMDQLKVPERLTKDEVVDAVLLITTDFKTLSIEDIGIAFRMIITQGYGEKTPSGASIEYSYFNRFSIAYICQFLRIYQQWKVKQNMNRPALIETPKKALDISETASRKTRRRIAEAVYDDVKNGRYFMLINIDSVFDEMEKSGLVSDWPELQAYYIEQATATQKKPEPTDGQPPEKKRKSGLLASLIFDIPVLNVPESDLNAAKRLYLKDRFLFWKDQKREKIFM